MTGVGGGGSLKSEAVNSAPPAPGTGGGGCDEAEATLATRKAHLPGRAAQAQPRKVTWECQLRVDRD